MSVPKRIPWPASMRARSAASILAALAAGLTVSALAFGEVPADIEAGLLKIGKIVDPPCTALLYRPLMPKNDIRSSATPLYPGITLARDVSFGPDPKDVVDVFTADKGPASRPVLIYVAGGPGNKIELQNVEANAFYDNIGRWATEHGMVFVNVQRHAGAAWDDGAKDISSMIQWVQANVGKYHGNPDRVFIWAHSAGNIPLANYAGHPELWGPKGLGLKGVIFMSPAAFDIAPVKFDAGNPADFMKMLQAGGKSCGAGSIFGSAGALPGKAPGQPGGPDLGPAAPPRGAPVDDATQLARSNLPELKKLPAKILLANGELDIGGVDPSRGNLSALNAALHDELCKAGPVHCPATLVAKGHSHMSIVFSIDTPDTSVSDPLLAWMKSVQ